MWDVPPDPQQGLMPRGEVLFAGSQTIPAHGTGDESLWTLQMDLPRNFWFRLVDVNMTGVYQSDNDVEEPQPGMRVLVDTDAPGQTQWNFPLRQVDFPEGTASPPIGIRITFKSATENEHMSFFHVPVGVQVDRFIDNSNGSGRLFLSWIDDGAAVTGDIIMSFMFRLLMYDTEQIFKFPVHTPVPTISP